MRITHVLPEVAVREVAVKKKQKDSHFKLHKKSVNQKLSNADVLWIRQNKAFLTVKQIQERFGLGYQYAIRVLYGDTHPHIR